MLKKLFYAIPGVLGAALFFGGLGLIGAPRKTGEAIFMLIMGGVFLFVAYRKFYLKKSTDDENESQKNE